MKEIDHDLENEHSVVDDKVHRTEHLRTHNIGDH